MVRKRVFRGLPALPLTLICAAGVLVFAAVPVQVTGKGIDLYAMLVAAVLLLTVERTLGDWVADLVGPAGTALAFAIVAAGGVAYLLSDGGQKRAQRFMVVAEAHGYRPVYFKSDRDADADDDEQGRTRPRLPDAPAAPPASIADPASAPAATSSASTLPPPSVGPGASPTTQSGEGFRWFTFSRVQNPATGRLTGEPELAQLGDEVVVRFRVIGKSDKPPSEVSFFANGVFLERASLRSDGTAETRWHPRAPGQYQLRALTTASSLDSTSFEATVQVVPRGR